jgi:hypothetical protein
VVTELVIVRLQAGIAGSVFITRLAMGSKAVRFFQNIFKVVTYPPHITSSPRDTVKKYDRGGKILLAVRIKASVNIVALNAKDFAGSVQ